MHIYLPALEFSVVCIFFVLPSLLHNIPVTIPTKPHLLADTIIIFFRVFAAAAYEELLYRAYLPDRLLLLLEKHSLPMPKKQLFAESFAVVCFALAHRYLGEASVIFAAGAGILFRILYCFIRRKHIRIIAFCTVWVLHGCWNSAVYYYLWNYSS